MNTRPLGSTGLVVSEIGFGAWGIGGSVGGAVAYGPTDDRQSRRALRRAFDRGVTLFDTANLYGDGHSERLLGEEFADVRDRIVLATKAGFVDLAGKQDFSPGGLRQSLENSLRRLQTDRVDLLQLHSPPPEILKQPDDLLRLLETLRREGKICAWGVSVRGPDDGLLAIDHLAAPCIQVNFNLADQRALENGLMSRCAQENVGLVIRTPLCFGFLTGRYDNITFDPADHRARWSPEQIRRWAEAGRLLVSHLAARDGHTPAQLALRFCLSWECVSTVIPGMLTETQVEENVHASALGPLAATDRAAIVEEYGKHTFFVARRP